MNTSFHSRKTSLMEKNKLLSRPDPIKKQQPCPSRISPCYGPRQRITSHWNQKKFVQYSENIGEWRKNQRGHVVGLKTCKIKLIQTDMEETYLPTVTEPEDIVIKLNKITKIPLKQSLYILESLLLGYSQIYQFLGYTCFSLSFCGITSGGKVKVWINSDFSSNYPEGQLIKDEILCVQEIMNGLKNLSDKKFQDFYFYYIRNAGKNKCGFKFTLSLLKSYIQCIKMKLPQDLNLQLIHQEYHNFDDQKSGYNLKTQPNERTNKKQNISHTCNLTAKRQKKYFPKTSQKKQISKVSSLKSFKKEGSLEKNQSLKINQKKSTSHSQNILSIKRVSPHFKHKSNEKFKYESTKKPNKLIMNQFSFAFNPRKTVGECETAAKESGISTTQKTDSYKMKESGQADWSFPTITSRKGLTHQSQNIQDISRENKGEKVFNLLSLLPQKLEEVESRGQCSDIQEITEMRKQSSDEQMEIKIKKKKDEVLKANLWTNKIDDLFSNARPTLKSSRVDGKEPEPVFHSSNTEKLDQWARMLSESLISEKL